MGQINSPQEMFERLLKKSIIIIILILTVMELPKP
jgi:hypothetical protein